MSTRRFSVTIACPRLFFEAGDPAQCECDIEVECMDEDGYGMSILSSPAFCTHTDDKMDVAFTAIEADEWYVRAHEAMAAFDRSGVLAYE